MPVKAEGTGNFIEVQLAFAFHGVISTSFFEAPNIPLTQMMHSLNIIGHVATVRPKYYALASRSHITVVTSDKVTLWLRR